MLSLTNTSIPDLTVCLDKASLHVSSPTHVIFACGGKADLPPPPLPASFRDAFLRIKNTSQLAKFQVRLAEEIIPFFPQGRYLDIQTFESDIAQISSLILLFPESPGSFAELGAFSQDAEIASRMLVVMTHYSFHQESFISLGPARALRNKYGRSAIYVLDDARLNIPTSGNAANIDLRLFSDSMHGAVNDRIPQTRDSTTFDKTRNGHIIKLITGLIQHYGSLKFEEIETLLYCLDIKCTEEQIHNFLLCAKFVRWIDEDERGLNTYYSARNIEGDAISFRLTAGCPIRDRRSWLSDIREYWKLNQPERFRSISQAMAG